MLNFTKGMCQMFIISLRLCTLQSQMFHKLSSLSLQTKANSKVNPQQFTLENTTLTLYKLVDEIGVELTGFKNTKNKILI